MPPTGYHLTAWVARGIILLSNRTDPPWIKRRRMEEPRQFHLQTIILELLPDFALFGHDDIKEVQKLLAQELRRRAEGMALTRSGPCVVCANETQYGYPPADMHVRHGEQWYQRRILPQIPMIVSYDVYGSGYSVGKYSYTSISSMICSGCHKKHSAEQKLRSKAWEEEQKIREENSKNYWQDLRSKHEQLRDMPYREFLQTEYWKNVRIAVLKKQRFRCGVCSEKNSLQVHHKTYASHGWEDEHLGDLIALCKECHSKFHGKLEVSHAY